MFEIRFVIIVVAIVFLATGCIQTIEADPEEMDHHIDDLVNLNLTYKNYEGRESIVLLIPTQVPLPAEVDGVIFTTYTDGVTTTENTYHIFSTEEGIKVATENPEHINIGDKQQETVGYVRKTQAGDIYLIENT